MGTKSVLAEYDAVIDELDKLAERKSTLEREFMLEVEKEMSGNISPEYKTDVPLMMGMSNDGGWGYSLEISNPVIGDSDHVFSILFNQDTRELEVNGRREYTVLPEDFDRTIDEIVKDIEQYFSADDDEF